MLKSDSNHYRYISMKINNVAVFCGSNLGNKINYQNATKALGALLPRHNMGLVYGGASVGIMGVLADTVLSHSGKVYGIIPQAMVEKEIAHKNLTKLFIVNSMHERKAKMSELSDGFILLPGGAGSLDEFFEIFTWFQLGYHNKPCAILNIDGYYNSLLDFIDHAIKNGFMKPEHRQNLIVDTAPESLLLA